MTEMDKLYEREDIYDVRTVENSPATINGYSNCWGKILAGEGLLKTPERVAKAMAFLTKGYGEDPKILLSAKFREDYRHMVVVKGYRTCTPIANINAAVLRQGACGLFPTDTLRASPRWHGWWSVRPTFSGAGAPDGPDSGLYSGGFGPDGRCGRHRGAHTCMQMRGIQKQNSVTTTLAFNRGVPEESEYAAKSSCKSSAATCGSIAAVRTSGSIPVAVFLRPIWLFLRGERNPRLGALSLRCGMHKGMTRRCAVFFLLWIRKSVAGTRTARKVLRGHQAASGG